MLITNNGYNMKMFILPLSISLLPYDAQIFIYMNINLLPIEIYNNFPHKTLLMMYFKIIIMELI
jgi:hypothetical protein